MPAEGVCEGLEGDNAAEAPGEPGRRTDDTRVGGLDGASVTGTRATGSTLYLPPAASIDSRSSLSLLMSRSRSFLRRSGLGVEAEALDGRLDAVDGGVTRTGVSRGAGTTSYLSNVPRWSSGEEHVGPDGSGGGDDETSVGEAEGGSGVVMSARDA